VHLRIGRGLNHLAFQTGKKSELMRYRSRARGRACSVSATRPIIEQNNADLKDSALAHMPSGVFAANSAWLVAAVMAYNLTRAVELLAAGPFGKARTGTIRRKLIHVPARLATSARRIRLHLPEAWHWQTPWQALFDHLYPPPQPA